MDNPQKKNLREYLNHYKKCEKKLSNIINPLNALIKYLSSYSGEPYLYSKSKEFCSYLKEEKKDMKKGINRLEKKLDRN
ncbi:MAG: hypothetical protein AABY32_06815 [Nanoarchaeota archaeon]